MALSIGKNGKADKVEERLRARLADLEGRLEDSSKITRLENHIVHLNEKHTVELERTRIEGQGKVNEVKAKAAEVVKETKRRLAAEQARTKTLVEDLARLEGQLKQVEVHTRSLAGKGLKLNLAPAGMSRTVAENPREFIAQLVSFNQDLVDRLTRIEASIGEGHLERQTTDLDILEERTKELLSNPEVKSKALMVTEKARMFANDPGKSQYYRELVVPYAQAIGQVLATESRASVVHGAHEALQILEIAFRDSRTFLLRRSGELDEHTIAASVEVERLEESAQDAMARLQAVIDNARALGPVDFFHNMQQELQRAVERGEQGAKAAAWILSDVTVTILEDEVVRGWLANQR